MSVRLVTGVPGSGKSYYLASYLTKNFCNYDPIAGLWELKENIQIYASLDGLKIQHKNLDLLIKQNTIEEIFNIEWWEGKVSDGIKTILVLDEAQRYFSSQTRLPDSVWYFFEYHRHLGLEIWLLTQSASSLNRRIIAVTDSYIEAAPPTLRIANIFRYRRRDTTTNEIIGREKVIAEQKIFQVYKSATHKEGLQKPKSALVKYSLVASILVIGGLIAAPLLFGKIIQTEDKKPTHKQKELQTKITKQYMPGPKIAAVDWRDIVYTGLHPGNNIPNRCRPYTLHYYRCGPLSTSLEGLPGAICNDKYCEILVPNNAAPTPAPTPSPSPRSMSEDERERGEGATILEETPTITKTESQ